ncbi:MAG: exosome complex RNA-binding protein Rrp4 [Candidatus Njordarchaeia archaeon]
MPIYFKSNDIVVPGDVIAEGDFRPFQGTYKIGKKIIAEFVGIVYIKENKIRVVPLEGVYYPREGDKVIGKIVDYSIVSWQVDINAPYYARLDASDYFTKPIDPAKVSIKEHLDIGDLVYAEIIKAERATNVQLVANRRGLGKLEGGALVQVSPKKIPRILGKNRSMIKMIRELTKSKIIVGHNGYIWVKANDKKTEITIIEVIKKIEKESHIPGLTERVRGFLTKKLNLEDDQNDRRKTETTG